MARLSSAVIFRRRAQVSMSSALARWPSRRRPSMAAAPSGLMTE
jgi:hypothetical protein